MPINAYREVMTANLAHITFDCADPIRLSGFWSVALGLPVDEGASEFFASITDTPTWFFIKVPEPKSVKNRVHVDLTAADVTAEIESLHALGATTVAEHDEWGTAWTVMLDPEGNEFCIAAGSS
jgi:predicted enzyme related to lactoylglutathione lyase